MNIKIYNTIGTGQLLMETTHADLIVPALIYAQLNGSVGISVHSEVFSGCFTELREAKECQKIHETQE